MNEEILGSRVASTLKGIWTS